MLCCYQIEQFYIVLFIEQLCMLYIQCCLLETTVVLLIKNCVLNLIISIIHVVDQYMYA